MDERAFSLARLMAVPSTIWRAIPLGWLLAACSMQAADVPFPDADELIAQVEARIVLPPGAGPLSSYTRTYSRLDPNRGPALDGYVFGVLERVGDGPSYGEMGGAAGSPARGRRLRRGHSALQHRS